jgi:hypothetical protein
MLWIALAAKHGSKRPSLLVGLNDDLIALDFDFACAYRLDLYDRDARKQLAQMIRAEVSSLWTGEEAEY